jgi:multidrug efflux pump
VLAVPVSLIGTFAGLLLLGYSINTLTLFGMVLAIGIVVDDAIVVLENVERIMHEEHLHAREAAIKAMQEVTGPVIAIVLVLCAVFVPIAFLGGLTGELYRQFAITIAIAVVISGMVALTLTPALCGDADPFAVSRRASSSGFRIAAARDPRRWRKRCRNSSPRPRKSRN